MIPASKKFKAKRPRKALLTEFYLKGLKDRGCVGPLGETEAQMGPMMPGRITTRNMPFPKAPPPEDPAKFDPANWLPEQCADVWDAMLVAELKGELKRHGLPTGGRKAELQDRLREEAPDDAAARRDSGGTLFL